MDLRNCLRPGRDSPFGADQAGVEARVARLAEPAVDVDPLDALVLLREREHVLRPRGGALQRVREARRLELDEAAGLGEPDLALGDGRDVAHALALAAVDVLVVVQAPDAALALRGALELAQVALDVARVEHVSRHDRALLAHALHGLVVPGRQLRLAVRRLGDVVDLVPRREHLGVRELLAEALDRGLVGLGARRLARLRLLVLVVDETTTMRVEGDQHLLLVGARGVHEAGDFGVLERLLRVIPRDDVAHSLELQLLPARLIEHGRVLL